MNHTRAHIRLFTQSQAVEFVSLLNADGTADKYILETGDTEYCVDARSLLGVLYFMTDHSDDTYLVNKTHDGVYPGGITNFRF